MYVMKPQGSFRNWIEAGYDSFAATGPGAVKIQSLARKIGVSKSSFYHHFGDQESFIGLLLEEHNEIAHHFVNDVKKCKQFDPDFIDLIIRNKKSVLFQRQLRVHREIPEFKACFERVTDEMCRQVLVLWAKFMGIESDLPTAEKLYRLIVDVFYERIREKNLNAAWLNRFLAEVQDLCNRMAAAK